MQRLEDSCRRPSPINPALFKKASASGKTLSVGAIGAQNIGATEEAIQALVNQFKTAVPSARL